jgi:hypothetical protein
VKASVLIQRLTEAVTLHGDRDVLGNYEFPHGLLEIEDEETVLPGSVGDRPVLLVDLGDPA